MTQAASESICPLCGGDNHCGNLAADHKSSPPSRCWCMDEYFDPSLKKSMPAKPQSRSCICRSCVLQHQQTVAVTPRD